MHGRKTTLAPWAQRRADPRDRAALGLALVPLLTPEVTLRLPADLAFDPDKDEIGAWIDRADRLADIHTITRKDTGALAGLLLLFSDNDHGTGKDGTSRDGGDLMIGYFLGPDHWGMGLASDMLAGLMARLDQGPPRRLFAGTDSDNLASQRVLGKAGFRRDMAGSGPGRVAFSRRCGC